MYGIPNCVPEYFREQQERYDRECELEMQAHEYYESNKEYRKQKQKDGCAEIDFYPVECETCGYGEEAPPNSKYDDFPTKICSNWKECQIFRKHMTERYDATWEEIKSWFE